ncbi:hypothetical protein HNQ94_003236 [Salirhabdus euzebyi]|uniref:Uncharacterized protein n=1 Tax=Salirhabdus euzebyi TaxID=394506 RepID=A0A841Q907_9BACI|nr:hypothetical protein [Salirhabdus euzebyi]MBB6454747.1 hypothetical protein [Salirhabdus euzebyi]
MNTFVETLLNWTKNKANKWTDNIKERIDKIAHSTNVTVNDVATLILLHPDTNKKENKYLGLVFHDCYLQIDNTRFYLETKGKIHPYVLTCKIWKNGELYSSYHSYKDKGGKINIPDSLKENMSKEV